MIILPEHILLNSKLRKSENKLKKGLEMFSTAVYIIHKKLFFVMS